MTGNVYRNQDFLLIYEKHKGEMFQQVIRGGEEDLHRISICPNTDLMIFFDNVVNVSVSVGFWWAADSVFIATVSLVILYLT